MRRLFVFDWDGTLMDSVGRIVSCLRQAAEEQGLEDLGDAGFGNVIGLGLPQAIARLYPQLNPRQIEQFRNTYSARFVAADARPSHLFPGALELLETLRARGHWVAVATGKSRRGLDRVLGELGLDDCFDATRCADETASKPDPRMLHEIVVALGAEPEQAVMIGDTEYDLEMAARARIRSLGVSFGVHSRERLARHAPERIVDSLPEILAWEELRPH
jgi:phosphoglycolate phosphatase